MSSHSPIPPHWPLRLLRRVLNPNYLEELEGDLQEQFQDNVQKHGLLRARRRYIWGAIKLLRPVLLQRLSGDVRLNQYGMFRHNCKVAFRQIAFRKFYSGINIFGLTIGITSSIFILLYIQSELSYDDFHENRDRIYRVVSRFTEAGTETDYGTTQIPLAAALKNNHTQVQEAVRLIELQRTLFENEARNLQSYEERFYYADPSVFEVFDFSFLKGDPNTALFSTHAAVITQSTARKYFGDQDPIGKSFRNENNGDVYQVTALIEDVPANSHLKFDALLSFSTFPEEQFNSWGSWFPITYVLLNEEHDSGEIERALANISQEHVSPIFQDYGVQVDYRLQPLRDIYLRSDFGKNAAKHANITYVYILGVVGLFLLVVACINYINLSTAFASKRVKEISIRKTMGSFKRQLRTQFLLESWFITMIATTGSFLIVVALLPLFNRLSEKELALSNLAEPTFIAHVVGILLFVGILAGSYPAFYLAKLSPISGLKGGTGRNAENTFLRRWLVVAQLVCSISMIIGTIVVYEQLARMRDAALGFSPEQVITVPMADPSLQANYNLVRDRLEGHSNIIEVSTSSSKPGSDVFYSLLDVDGPEGVVNRGINYLFADYNFVETLGISIEQGRNFSRDFAADTAAALVNLAMVKRMNWIHPIGKSFVFNDNDDLTPDPTFQVVGVIKDYHHHSLHSLIEPMAIFFRNESEFLTVKIASRDIHPTLAFMKDQWRQVNAGYPFSYDFLDEEFELQYRADNKRGELFSVFSGLTLLIACLGLLGLSAFVSEQYTKQVSIRRVLGADSAGLIYLLSKDFLKLVLLALCVSIPLSWYFMDKWLEDFAYRTTMHWWIFVGVGIGILIMTLLTVGHQVIKVVFANPVNSLRNE